MLISRADANVREAVVRTLLYATVFEAPLSFTQLWGRLQYPRPISRKKLLQILQAMPGIQSRNDMYWLATFESNLWFPNTSVLSQKLQLAQRAANILARIPTIQAIYVTGSVAAEHVAAHDDLDFMLIVQPGTLWRTRFAAVILAILCGRYRSREPRTNKSPLHTEKKWSNFWCLNLWLDTNHLQVDKKSRNIYTAHEVFFAKPLVDKKMIHQSFLQQNTWMLEYFGNASSLCTTNGMTESKKSKNSSSHSQSHSQESAPFVERIAFGLQKKYMQGVQTSEKIGYGFAFFHPRPMYAFIQDKLQELRQKVQ